MEEETWRSSSPTTTALMTPGTRRLRLPRGALSPRARPPSPARPRFPCATRSLLIRHHTGPGNTLYIDDDGASTAQGYPLALGQVLDLPLTTGVMVTAVTGAQISNTGVRTLEAG